MNKNHFFFIFSLLFCSSSHMQSAASKISETALRIAHSKVFPLLPDGSALPGEKKDSHGNTALYNAILIKSQKRSLKRVRLLLEVGADPITLCQNQETPLALATRLKKTAITKLLLEAMEKKSATE